jgi:AraC-like DNA-binding protein
LANGQASQFWSWIVEDQDEVRVHIHRTFQPGVLGYTQSEWIGVMGVLTIVQLFGGPRWQPSRISLGTRSPVPERAREIFGDTRFLTRQSDVYIAFPRSMVSLRRRQHGGDSRFDPPVAPPSTYASEEPESDFAGRLMQCLEPHFLDGYPHVALGAEIAGTSVRTLQRRLAAAGFSYSEVVDRARFDVASRMLAETDALSIQIAQATAYSDPSHFARAFRRSAGVSPSEYRKQAQLRSAE